MTETESKTKRTTLAFLAAWRDNGFGNLTQPFDVGGPMSKGRVWK